MKKPGFEELAKAAGVSMATVDRALNGRQKVRADTVTHIAEVARRIGHPAAYRFAGAEGARPVVRFGVVLHKQGQGFYKAFAEELRRAVATAPGIEGRLVLEFSTGQAPGEMAAKLLEVGARCDVVAATAVNHPEVTAAVETLRARGIAVFALLSEFAIGLRAGYLGLDNLKVGRTAAWMLATHSHAPGEVAVFVGGHRWHGHELRDQGFRDGLRQHGPGLRVLETRVNLETKAVTYEAVRGLLARHPELRGIYVAGGGMEGAVAALRDSGAGGRVALVVSALTPESRKGLAEGQVTLVIDTPLEALCRALMERMAGAALARPAPVGGDVMFLPPAYTLPETL
ncbi:LacI family DNA-binding transcriptional regulator [Fuscibacter oryzae]|uniref:LacI family DNA-binding transcriptional regulator n=1 Tax=Fuscibacter oryzae TaxID=2803939 RepID=A0A8J7SS35_9RHOB|nr:LacI family DNA-binding transcriptional regulator [Fuscibacter oryzae]MBL4926477.1 LacI family DNA-binding transcriptional regulator [Fuscibacter oryzae]